MNIFHKVAVAALKKNRSRTAVTIIGIALSASLICAVTTSVASLRQFVYDNTVYREGSWHGAAECVPAAEVEALTENEKIDTAVTAQILGYAEIGSSNAYKPYVYVLGMGEGFSEMMPVHVTEGELPDAPDEILLPAHLADNGDVHYTVGDTITLQIGERQTPDGYALYQHNPYYGIDEETGEPYPDAEVLAVRETRTFRVVGICERLNFENFSAPGYTCLTVQQPGDFACDVYFTMQDAHKKEVQTFVSELPYAGEENNDLLRFSGVSLSDAYNQVLYGMTAILIGLIMFGSVSLIYNAFSISVSERTKQFGLLSSIGATRKQLRMTVLYEALTVSLIGIPAGILIGIAGIGITLHAMSSRFLSVTGYVIPIRLCATFPAIMAAAVLGLVTVLISAWIPSKRAVKITAVEAIRQQNDIKLPRRILHTPKWVYRLFGLPGMLAQKQFRRSRKRYRATIVSLFMSIVLFVSSSAFTMYLTDSTVGVLDTMGFDLRYYIRDGEMEEDTSPERLKALFDAEPHVTDCACLSTNYTIIDLPKSAISEAGTALVSSSEVKGKPDMYAASVALCFLDDSTFRSWIAANGLDESLFYGATPAALTVDGFRQYDSDTGKYSRSHVIADPQFTAVTEVRKSPMEGYVYVDVEYDENGVPAYMILQEEATGERIHVPYEESNAEVALYSAAVTDDAPYFLDLSSGFAAMVYPMSRVAEIMGSDYGMYYSFLMLTDDHVAAYDALLEKVPEKSNLYDFAQDKENERSLLTIVQVFSGGFIILISLIAVANVFNTISTNVALRRREFAMLRSVGMTQGGLRRMLFFECLLYGLKALLYGLPVSVGATVLVWVTVKQGFDTGFYLPWSAMLTSAVSVFAVVLITMGYAMQKIRKDNPIDALKNENL